MEEKSKSTETREISPQDSMALITVSKCLWSSGVFPQIKNAMAAYCIVQYGYEHGVGPMTALQNINFISGKPVANGQIMLAKAYEKGVTVEVKREDETGCEILFKRPGHPDYLSAFTVDDAEAAGLLSKDNWRKYPKDMYYWRAVAKGIRRIAPDAMMGAYTPDELADAKPVDIPAEPLEVETEAIDIKTGEIKNQPSKGGFGSIKEMESKYDNGGCYFCGQRHIKKGDIIVGVEGKWGAKECYQKHISAAEKEADQIQEPPEESEENPLSGSERTGDDLTFDERNTIAALLGGKRFRSPESKRLKELTKKFLEKGGTSEEARWYIKQLAELDNNE